MHSLVDTRNANRTLQYFGSARVHCETGAKREMNKSLKDLSHCGDIGTLEAALRELCSGFGSVSRLDVLPMVGAGNSQAVCLMRLDSSEREQELMAKLGASRFGENVYLVIDFGRPN